MPSSARVPRQALLVVRRHSTLCSPLGAAARSARVRRRTRLVDSFSLRVQLLYIYTYTYGCSRLRRPRSALLASLRACSASGWACAQSRRGPHMHAVVPRALPRDAVVAQWSYALQIRTAIMACRYSWPSGFPFNSRGHYNLSRPVFQ